MNLKGLVNFLIISLYYILPYLQRYILFCILLYKSKSVCPSVSVSVVLNNILNKKILLLNYINLFFLSNIGSKEEQAA